MGLPQAHYLLGESTFLKRVCLLQMSAVNLVGIEHLSLSV